MKKALLIILAVVLVVVLVAAVVADAKYKAILSSPRIDYAKAEVVSPGTRGLILIEPPKGENYFKALLAEKGIPAWVLPLGLAYEGALSFDLDYVLNSMKLTAFINDKRFGPIVCDKVNAAKMPPPFNEWLKDKMTVQQRGVLIRHGEAKMDRGVTTKIREMWKDAKVTEPAKAEGGHLLELVLDNRDGGAATILLTLAAPFVNGKFDLAEMANEGRLGTLMTIGIIRITADIQPDKTVKIRLLLDCSPAENDSMVTAMGAMVDTGSVWLQSLLQPQKIDVKGQSKINGKVVEAEYTFTNFDEVLKRYI